MTKLQREWEAKLKASGFVDLEGPGGMLSDRGNLHPVAETEAETARLGQRIQDGHAYTSWAQSILHAVTFETPQEREVWRLHADGMSQAEIGTALTIARRSVRRHLTRVENRVSKVSRQKRWQDEKRHRMYQIQALVRACDPGVLAKLVAVMMRQQGLNSR